MKDLADEFDKHRSHVTVPIIFILDCCRVRLDGDRSRSVARGTRDVSFDNSLGKAPNILMLYSTASGYIASDGDNESPHGAYTGLLIKYLLEMDTIERLAKRITRDLYLDPRYERMQV